jgi:hypothetical protein
LTPESGGDKFAAKFRAFTENGSKRFRFCRSDLFDRRLRLFDTHVTMLGNDR